MERQHQPQEEQLAVARLIGLGGVAERRRHDREPVILQPPGGKDQVIAEAVVERQRRLDKADGHDEREHREHDHRDMEQVSGSSRLPPRRRRRTAKETADATARVARYGRRPEKAEAAE